jgi:transposase-like protein
MSAIVPDVLYLIKFCNMTHQEFSTQFPTEESCIKYFKTQKESKGIKCKKCGSTEHYWNKTYTSHDCKKCQYRTTLRSGTVMESSKLTFKYWLYTIYLMTMTKKPFSAKEVQRQLGHKRYEPIWTMMHKIRCIMGLRDDSYEFEGIVEVDDAFFKTYSIDNEQDDKKDKPNKRGRGSEAQSTVLVMAKVEPVVKEPKKHQKNTKFRFVKMLVIPDSGSQTMNKVVSDNTNKDKVTLKTDGWKGFNKFKEISKKHIQQVVKPKEASKVLPWVHTMISNAKRSFLGVNHQMQDEYLQNYLNEFCYKTNRRYFGDKLFDRLVVAALEDTWFGKLRYAQG